MNIAFFVNDPATEHAHYGTTALARAAVRAGHEVWYIGVEHFIQEADGTLAARMLPAPAGADDEEQFVAALQDDDAEATTRPVADLDILFLRNNPADDADRLWAQTAGIQFGQMAMQSGVHVVNDPSHLANALSKLYFQFFPEEVRPRTLISRDRTALRRFVEQQDGKVVMKPLQGSGGESVFLVRGDDDANSNQIIDAIQRDGYVVAQEYLPAADQGDVRLLLVNGTPLQVDGRYAAMRRVRSGSDLRSNIHAGGSAEPAEVTEAMLHIAEMVRPRLVRDGMFLVGLDICGDHLLEVNVFSPGGLWSMEQFEGVPFAAAVVDALERKVAIARRYPGTFSNAQLATM